MKTILLISFFFLNILMINAQCNDSILRIAKADSGADAFFMKEFKIKFDKGRINHPAPVAKFTAYLKKGIEYRFNVANAAGYEGKAVLQLFRRGKILGSTINYDEKKDNKFFNYTSYKTAKYQVLMSFDEGKAGCSVGVMSVVVNDSTKLEDLGISELKEVETLYIGIENPLTIASTEEEGCYLDIKLDKGEITGKNGKYFITVKERGFVSLTANTVDTLGNIRESKTKKFIVKEFPLPNATINGINGGLISKYMLLSEEGLSLETLVNFDKNNYKIIGFSISDSFTGGNSKQAYSEKFTVMQKMLIRSLKPNSNLYINNITVKFTNGKIARLAPLAFILQ